jgi:hypothetical protein
VASHGTGCLISDRLLFTRSLLGDLALVMKSMTVCSTDNVEVSDGSAVINAVTCLRQHTSLHGPRAADRAGKGHQK